MRDRINVLWRHYSSWFLYAAGASAAALQDPNLAPYLSFLPKWIVVYLVIGAIISKLIPQKPVAK